MAEAAATKQELERQAAIAAAFRKYDGLYSDLRSKDAELLEGRPLLAHYTSIQALERILVSNELWFSSPLLMNDVEELRFGMLEGHQQVMSSSAIRQACGSDARVNKFLEAFNKYSEEFRNAHALDVFVLCMSEHTKGDSDGLLSMWRGYGGNGTGAAIVFDTARIGNQTGSPLVASKVDYLSTDARRIWLSKKVDEFADLLKQVNTSDDFLFVGAWAIFLRIKLFAMFTKHHGFSEEKEWRVVYLKERDVKNLCGPMIDYFIGPQGVELKLKLKVEPKEGLTAPDLSLGKVVHQIILGPSAATPLAMAALLRMLDKIGKPEFKNRIVASGIPFRGRI